jgi:uncharacterized membrane protein YjgN (DUF898 family)
MEDRSNDKLEPLDNLSVDQLVINDQTRSYLKETARWAKFLAIVGFVFIGLMALMGFFFASAFSSMAALGSEASELPIPSTMPFVFIYFVILLLYIMPTLYLYRFADRLQTSLKNNSQSDVNAAFENLKSLFKFVGILTVIMIFIYGLLFIFGILTSLFIR